VVEKRDAEGDRKQGLEFRKSRVFDRKRDDDEQGESQVQPSMKAHVMAEVQVKLGDEIQIPETHAGKPLELEASIHPCEPLEMCVESAENRIHSDKSIWGRQWERSVDFPLCWNAERKLHGRKRFSGWAGVTASSMR
jgi:hypothetical protein